MLGPSRAVGGVSHVKSTVFWWIRTQILVDWHQNFGGFASKLWWIRIQILVDCAPYLLVNLPPAATHPIRWNNDRVGAASLRDFSLGDRGVAPLSTGPPRPHRRVQALEQRKPLPATAVCAAGGCRQRRPAQSIPGRHRAHTPGTPRDPVFGEC